MKSLIILSLTLVTTLTSSFAQNPPKGLKWGMSYDQVKTHLATLPKNKRSKIDKPIIIKPNQKKRDLLQAMMGGIMFIDNVSFARLKNNLKIADKKISKCFLYFHPNNDLCSVHYQVDFNQDDRVANELAWQYFKKTQSLLSVKYGEPVEGVDLDTPHISILAESPIKSRWVSKQGDVVMTLTLRKINQLFFSYPAVQLQYSTKFYYELLQEQLKRLAAKEEIL